MENFFRALAVILGGVAAYFLWQGNGDRAFVSAVAGAVSFFLSIRTQVKRRLNEREAERLAAERATDELNAADDENEIADQANPINNEQLTTDKQ